MLKKLFRPNSKTEQHRADLYRNLIRHEAKIGGRIFGQTQPGVRREFFCLDERTWVWHEEWTDGQGEAHVQTTRYDVRPDGILKSQHGKYQPVTVDEANRLYNAARMYQDAVRNELYSFAR